MLDASTIVASVALVVSAVGWVVSYRLQLKANKASAHRSLLNEAVDRVSTAIWSFQDWSSDVNGRVLGLETQRDIAWRLGAPDVRTKGLRELRIVALTDPRSFYWIRYLETYEPFFPQTRGVRMKLMLLVRELQDHLGGLLDAAELGPMDTARIQPISNSVLDLVAPSWDMLVYVQNHAFEDLTGHGIQTRQPAAPQSVLIRCKEDGTLVLERTGGLTHEAG